MNFLVHTFKLFISKVIKMNKQQALALHLSVTLQSIYTVTVNAVMVGKKAKVSTRAGAGKKANGRSR